MLVLMTAEMPGLFLTVVPCAAAEALRVTLEVLTQISKCEGLSECGRWQGCLAEQKFSLESIETERSHNVPPKYLRWLKRTLLVLC